MRRVVGDVVACTDSVGDRVRMPFLRETRTSFLREMGYAISSRNGFVENVSASCAVDDGEAINVDDGGAINSYVISSRNDLNIGVDLIWVMM